MMRDSQRSKVYAAEAIMTRSAGDMRRYNMGMTIDECQHFVDKIIGSAYVQRKYQSKVPKELPVYATHGGARASGPMKIYRPDWGEYERRPAHIRLGVWARQEYVILHEVAHHITGIAYGHGWQFCDVLLDLVRHFLGQHQHDLLLASFKIHKVRYRKPIKRTITEERRQQLREQLVAAREAKAAKSATQ